VYDERLFEVTFLDMTTGREFKADTYTGNNVNVCVNVYLNSMFMYVCMYVCINICTTYKRREVKADTYTGKNVNNYV
jgi:hypothetical protein